MADVPRCEVDEDGALTGVGGMVEKKYMRYCKRCEREREVDGFCWAFLSHSDEGQ
jgi:hypothetical protein